ncbi:heterodisulfide reductase-related iron-sulfur binding cluster [Micromonospora sp. CPCC 205561]|uniref:heterodisulfide reductase-related iron-sulfur binding cluster n=1 Tax=Micromonospora sp. CPCC 205561 TaxID=3122407 RepID=UPI003FA5E76C
MALFVTCLADTVFPQAAMATVRLLERLGHAVVFPEGQTCCGQTHVNSGHQAQALSLVRRHVRAFEPFDVVVAPSGSCVGSVRHQHARVARRAGDGELVSRAAAADLDQRPLRDQ